MNAAVRTCPTATLLSSLSGTPTPAAAPALIECGDFLAGDAVGLGPQEWARPLPFLAITHELGAAGPGICALSVGFWTRHPRRVSAGLHGAEGERHRAFDHRAAVHAAEALEHADAA